MRAEEGHGAPKHSKKNTALPCWCFDAGMCLYDIYIYEDKEILVPYGGEFEQSFPFPKKGFRSQIRTLTGTSIVQCVNFMMYTREAHTLHITHTLHDIAHKSD